jgi:hypothetical protein
MLWEQANFNSAVLSFMQLVLLENASIIKCRYSLTNQNQIINNQFITLQRSFKYGYVVVKFLLLVCCIYVNFSVLVSPTFY